MPLEPLYMNLITIAAEVVIVVILLVILNWIVKKILGWMTAAPAMRRLRAAVDVVRQNVRLLIVLVGGVVCLGIIGVNGYLMYRGELLHEYTLERARNIPRDFWTTLAIGLAKSFGLVIITGVVLRIVRRALNATCEKAKAFEGVKANDESLDQLFAVLTRTIRRAAWLYVLALSASFVGLPQAQNAVIVVLKIYLIIAIGLLAWRSLDAVIASLDALSRKYSSAKNLMRFYEHLSPLVPAFRRAVEWVIYVIVAALVVAQIEIVAPLADWGPRLVRIIGILFLSRVIVEVAKLLVDEFLIRRAKLTPPQRQRRLTIAPLIKSVTKYAIYFTAAIIVIKELGFNPTPVLAGAGIMGLAVGLGAQNLINDIVSGFFILFENYYLVGDYIETGEAEGEVESIELRATRIRDRSGRLHIVRNGQIDYIVNYSKEYTFAVVEVGVAYESDLDRVTAALDRVGAKIAEDNDDVLSPTVVKGLDGFGESELTYRTVTKVKPGRHLDVERAIRRLIKETFDADGIEIPYARRVMIFQDADKERKEAFAGS